MKFSLQQIEEKSNIQSLVSNFLIRFHVGTILRQSCIEKQDGIPATRILTEYILSVFSKESLYTKKKILPELFEFEKDVFYRFLNSLKSNWIKFTTRLASAVINGAVTGLTSENERKVFIVDDSVFDRNRSKKVELLSKVYDHAGNMFLKGFRMLCLRWSDGRTFVPVNSVLLSSTNKKNRY